MTDLVLKLNLDTALTIKKSIFSKNQLKFDEMVKFQFGEGMLYGEERNS